MIEIPVRYQASLFLNTADFGPTAQNITTLLPLFGPEGLLPATFHEVGNSPLGPGPIARLRFATPGSEAAIAFASDRVTVERTCASAKGENMKAPADFAEFAVRMVGKLFQAFPRRAYRLSLVTKVMLMELPDAQMHVIYKKLFLPTPFYQENIPFEWNWRSVGDFPESVGALAEKINLITEIARAVGVMRIADTIKEFDRIFLDLDINTKPKSLEARFGIGEIDAFYKIACHRQNEMTKQIISAIG